MTHRTASCSCGQLQAHVDGEPIRVSVCHCLACQRRTGSVFGAQARFASSAVTIQGTSKAFVRKGDEGTRSSFHFCPACRSTVYCTAEGLPGSVAVPVGAFADPAFPAPTFSIYEERMHRWVGLPQDIAHRDQVQAAGAAYPASLDGRRLGYAIRQHCRLNAVQMTS